MRLEGRIKQLEVRGIRQQAAMQRLIIGQLVDSADPYALARFWSEVTGQPLARMEGRIALQEYTLLEAAELTGMSVRTVVRRYTEALDRLTLVFLRLKLLQMPGSC